MSSKFKALFITPVTPSDNGPGVNRRCASHIAALARKFDVHVLIIPLYLDNAVTKVPDNIQALCHRVTIIKPVVRSGPIPGWLPFALPLNELLAPEGSFSIPNNSMAAKAREELGDEPFEIVLCFRTTTANVLHRIKSVLGIKYRTCAVDFDDIESSYLARQRNVERTRNGFQYDLMLNVRQRRQQSIERRLLRQFDVVSICSEKDKGILLQSVSTANIAVLPNCIKCPAMVPEQISDKFSLVFIGTMSYPPNEDAALYFCKEILPIIRDETSNPIQLFIVGYNPSSRILALGDDPGITVTGAVDSVDDYYLLSQCVIAPIRFGAGTRIKILEAMSFGRPVVSTTLGAEGIVEVSGEVAFLEDTTEGFARVCLDLITNSELRDRIGRNGRTFVETEFSLDHCYKELISMLDNHADRSNQSLK